MVLDHCRGPAHAVGMKTNELRINQLSDSAFAWYVSYLEALDAKRLDAYAEFLADGVVMQMNGQVPVEGKAAVVKALAAYWPSFGSLEHDLLNIYGSDQHFMLEALNHYTRCDGRPVTTRAVALTDRNPEGQVTSIRLYADVGALFASD